MTYSPRKAPRDVESYRARTERARSFGEHLDRQLRALCALYNRHPGTSEAKPIAALREAHALAVAQLQSDRDYVARISAQRPTALRDARLQWRRAEVEISRLRVEIAQVQLARAEAQQPFARAA